MEDLWSVYSAYCADYLSPDLWRTCDTRAVADLKVSWWARIEVRWWYPWPAVVPSCHVVSDRYFLFSVERPRWRVEIVGDPYGGSVWNTEILVYVSFIYFVSYVLNLRGILFAFSVRIVKGNIILYFVCNIIRETIIKLNPFRTAVPFWTQVTWN